MAARKAGQIVIQLNAGTAQFIRDMDVAHAKIGQFGTHTTSNMRAASAAIRTLEGNVTNNVRAVEAFLSTTLKLGPVLQAAFPLVGAIAFAGLIGEMGKKVYDFVENIKNAPEKISGAFRELNAPLKLTNEELQVTNDRLANDIAKLEGKRQNTLKLALDEAKLAADKLAEALDKDLGALDKLLQEQAGKGLGGWISRLFGMGGAGSARELAKELGGETGFGGFRGRIAGITDPKELQAAFASEIATVEQMRKGAASTRSDTLTGRETKSLDSATAELFDRTIKNLQEEMARIGLETQGGSLQGRKADLEARAEALRPIIELEHQLAQAQAEAAGGKADVLKKIDIEEQGEIQRLAELHQLNEKTLPLVEQIYDAKRIAAYNAYIEQTDRTLTEQVNRWTELELRAHKTLGEALPKEVQEGKKQLEELSKTIPKIAAELNKLKSEADSAVLQHQVRMIGLAPGASNNPLGTLAAQQALERVDIEKRYNEQLALASTPLEKAVLIRQRDLELQKQQFEWEERVAEVRQKGVRDFFAEMQGQAQTAGNIFYEAMHSGLDRVSDQLSRLGTGQKTSFGKMFQDLGQEMERNTIKSGLQRGLGAIGKRFGITIPTKADGSSEANAMWVRWAGQSGSANLPGAGGGALSGLGGGTLGRLGKIFGGSAGGFIFNLIPHADGGSVSPGSAYLVGERGPEPFFPGTSGMIMSNAVARRTFGNGGNQYSYAIDARGADLGASNRIARSIEMAHNSAVATSVRANMERSKRTPQRTNG